MKHVPPSGSCCNPEDHPCDQILLVAPTCVECCFDWNCRLADIEALTWTRACVLEAMRL